jgi:hypothetical protein
MLSLILDVRVRGQRTAILLHELTGFLLAVDGLARGLRRERRLP